MTRAKAAEVAAVLHIDEDALLELPGNTAEKPGQATPDGVHRRPLGEIAGNNGSIKDEKENAMRNTRAAVKSKMMAEDSAEKNNDIADECASLAHAEDQSGEVIPDTIESVPSPASEAAAEDLMKVIPEC
jgi:hypothetical protein